LSVRGLGGDSQRDEGQIHQRLRLVSIRGGRKPSIAEASRGRERLLHVLLLHRLLWLCKLVMMILLLLRLLLLTKWIEHCL
jgi:hypothetical protein